MRLYVLTCKYVCISQLDKLKVILLYIAVATICTFFIITGDDLTVITKDTCHLIDFEIYAFRRRKKARPNRWWLSLSTISKELYYIRCLSMVYSVYFLR